MKTISRIFAALVFVACASGASAGLITDTVYANDREWVQIDLFSGVSWEEINVVCPGGICGNTTLNGFDMSGWHWASTAEAIDLMSSFGAPDPGSYPTQYFEIGSDWAPAFFAAGFRPTWAAGGPGIYAWTSEFDDYCDAGPNCGVTLSVLNRNGGQSDFYELFGNWAGLQQNASGALFYTPEPSTAALFSLALLLIMFFVRKPASKRVVGLL